MPLKRYKPDLPDPIMRPSRVRPRLLAKSPRYEHVALSAARSLGIEWIHQHPLQVGTGRIYYPDLWQPALCLVVELDGPSHLSDCRKKHDQQRTEAMRGVFAHVVRFPDGMTESEYRHAIRGAVVKRLRAIAFLAGEDEWPFPIPLNVYVKIMENNNEQHT